MIETISVAVYDLLSYILTLVIISIIITTTTTFNTCFAT